MKIFISTLLLLIAAFRHFGELNASEINEAGPSGSPSQHPHLPETERKNKKLIKRGKPKPQRIISFADKEFGVWYHGVKPREVRLMSARNIIPDEEYRRKYNIENHYVEKDGVRFVMFVMHGMIMGAQYAPASKKTDSNVLGTSNDPTRTFFYDGKEVGVWDDSLGRPHAVRFVSGNVIPKEIDHRKFRIRTQMVHQNGVFFLVYRVLPTGNLLGVELAPRWNPPY